MLRIYTALILIAVFVIQGFGQSDPTSQSCGRRDTIIITTQASTDFTLNIEDYVNNDLANPDQSLCGVEIRFLHQFIDKFNLRLTSPGGQTVELIGPATDEQFAFTIGARWAIRFVRCDSTAVPDSSYTAIFNNSQPNNFVAFGNYTGSYYPYQGCIEDFNTGPVNGIWTFEMDNTASNFYPGAMVQARLIFCDSRGVDCCFSNPGDLIEADLLACEGDSSLLLEPDPFFSLPQSDSVEYGYTYLLAEDSIFTGLDSMPNLRTYPAGNYQVCGLSYRRSEIDSFWMPNGVLRIDSIADDLNSFTPKLCAKLTSNCQNIQIVAPPDTTFLSFTECAGDTLFFENEAFTADGIYYVNLAGFASCDSIIEVNLDVLDPIMVNRTETICEGDSVIIGTSVYKMTGIYQDILTSVDLGCDSTVNLDLTVLAPIITDLERTICAGDAVSIGDSTYTRRGMYENLLLSSQNCDSIVRLDLTVLEPIAIIELFEPIDCRNDSISLDGGLSLPNGQLAFEWFNGSFQSVGNNSNLFVDEADFYALVVTQTLNGQSCQDTSFAAVVDNRIYPVADAGLSDTLDCSTPSLILGGPTTSSGPDFLYNWTASAGGLAAPNNTIQTTVNIADVYQLVVTDDRNGCQDVDSVQVFQDTSALQVTISGNELLGCVRLQDTLVANVMGNGDFSISWSGACVDEQADGSIIVNCAGDFTVEVTRLQNNCVTTATVSVLQDISPPTAMIAPVDTLNCIRTDLDLDASASSPIGSLEYFWTGPGITGSFQGQMLNTSLAGDYQVRVIRTDNLCADSSQVFVFQDTLSPIADTGLGGSLSCNRDTIVLAGPNTSIGDAYIYEWYNSTGLIPAENDPILVVDQADIYTFVVSNINNGCQDSSVVNISGNFATPNVIVNPTSPFFCPSSPATLDGSQTDISFTSSIRWEGPCLEGPINTLTAQASCPGAYWLLVTNLESGCIDSAMVSVEAQAGFTVAMLPDTVLQDCITGLATLSTAGSSTGTVEWLFNGATTALSFPDPVVSQAGTYSLIVSNLGGTCRDTAISEVLSNCSLLSVISTPDTISCLSPVVELSGIASSMGPNIEYLWLPPENGCILEGQNTAEISVQCSGEYGLIVNDVLFALADTSYVTVWIDTIAPIAQIAVPDTLTCSQTQVQLDGSGSGLNPSYAFFWSADASGDTIGTTPIIQVGAAGVYLLSVYELRNGCSDIEQVQLRRDDQIPEISFGDNVIPCLQDTFTLQSFVSPSADYTYSWSGPGIQGNTDGDAILIDSAGTYYLEVINAATLCEGIDSVEVSQQACVPCLELVRVDTLDCSLNIAVIEADFCRECVDCSLQWFDSSGPIVGDTNLILSVSEAGIYRLVSVDTLGFSNELAVEVVADRDPPVSRAGPDRFLSCDSLSLTLGDINTSEGPIFSYSWTRESGDPISNPQDQFISVNEVDTYYLLVSNTENNCSTLDTVVVGIDTIPPTADAGPSQLLNCGSPNQALDASMSSTGMPFSYQWTSPDPTCITGANTLSPIVSCAGLYTLEVKNNQNGCIATDTVSVNVEAGLPPLVIFPDTNLTCRDSSIVLVGNLPATGNFTPRWCEVNANGDPLPTTCTFDTELVIARPGRFQYLLTNDDTDCENSFIVTVGEDFTSPNVEAGAPQTLLCTLDSIQLQGIASAGMEIEWTQADGFNISDNQSLEPFVYQPATYILQVTNPLNGCTALDSVEIRRDDAAPQADAGLDTLLNCTNTQIRLTGSGSTNSGMIQYDWSSDNGNIVSGTNQSDPLINAAGWYILSVSDPQNGCSSIDSVLVVEDTLQAVAVLENLGNLLLDCNVDTLLLDASNSFDPDGGNLNFLWSVRTVGSLIGDVQSDQVETSTPGGYRVVICKESNACCTTIDFSVTADFSLPALSITPPLDLTCDREQVSLFGESPENGTYTWSNSLDQVIGLTQTLDVNSTDTYTLLFTADDNGCQRSNTVMVNADTALPTVSIIDPSSLDCATASVILDGSASSQGDRFVYQWTSLMGSDVLSGANSLLAEIDMAGMYQLMVRDTVNGCRDSTQTEVISEGVTITGLQLEVENPGCAGDLFGSIAILGVEGGTPPYRYAINNGPLSSIDVFDALDIGTYDLQVVDALGCDWLEVVSIQEAASVQIDLGPDIEIELGDSLTLFAQLSVNDYESLLWQPRDLFGDSQLQEQSLTPTEGRFIIATVTDLNGCMASDTLRIFVVTPEDVFIPDGFSPNGDGANDFFSVFTGSTVARLPVLRVFDRWGNMVYERLDMPQNNPTLGWDGTFNGRPMNAAVFVYYLEIEYIDGRKEFMTGDVLLMR